MNNSNRKNIVNIADINTDYACDYSFWATEAKDTENLLKLLDDVGEYQCEYHTPMKIKAMGVPYLLKATFDVWKQYSVKGCTALVCLGERSYIISTFPHMAKNDNDPRALLETLVDYAFSLPYDDKDERALKYNRDEMNEFTDTDDSVLNADYFYNHPEEFPLIFTIIPDEENCIEAINSTEGDEHVENISFVSPGYTKNGYGY